MLVEVIIKLIVVLATYLEEKNVLLWVFSSGMCKFKSFFAMPMEDPRSRSEIDAIYIKAFDDLTIPDIGTLSLTN